MELLLTSDWGRPLERGLTLCSQADRSVRITYPLGQTFPPVFSPPLSCADAASHPGPSPAAPVSAAFVVLPAPRAVLGEVRASVSLVGQTLPGLAALFVKITKEYLAGDSSFL